jgi:clan AA aspartic protease
MTLLQPNYKYRRPTEGTSLTGGKEMGYIYAEIELTNGDDLAFHRRGALPENEIRKITTRALVDCGAWDLVLNEEIAKRLDLPVLDKATTKLADETPVEVDIVGPVQVRFEDHTTIVTAIVLPTTAEVLLGAFPLQGLDAFIDAKRERLLVHPESPDNPKSKIRLLKRVA